MKTKVLGSNAVWIAILIFCVLLRCEGQRSGLARIGIRQLMRSFTSVPQGRSATVRDVHMTFYGSNSTTDPVTYTLKEGDEILAHPHFNKDKPTVIYAHGYVELLSDTSAQTIVEAYIENGHFNIIMLDWSNLAFGNYLSVALNVPTVGKNTGAAVSRWIKQGFPVESLHLVGHSLGVHLMAYAARYLAERGHKVPRLTGLDPALPGFYPALLGRPITKADAIFVDIIHTDGGAYGTTARTGHADWWPNGGSRLQPGCTPGTIVFTDDDFCSHWRSWMFWAESVKGGEFVSKRCASYEEFRRGQCEDSPSAYMGLRATPDLRGNFYLRTSDKAPFALGDAGAVPVVK